MRCYYAVLDNDVYSFTRKSVREEFCKRTGAKRIYAYERHKYHKYADTSETHRNIAKSNETLKSDKVIITTQNSVNRSISERRKMFKGQR